MRLFSHGKLKTWTQERCEDCQRFLSRFQKKVCNECSKKRNNVLIYNMQRYTKKPEYRESVLLRNESLKYSYYAIRSFLSIDFPSKVKCSLGLNY